MTTHPAEVTTSRDDMADELSSARLDLESFRKWLHAANARAIQAERRVEFLEDALLTLRHKPSCGCPHHCAVIDSVLTAGVGR